MNGYELFSGVKGSIDDKTTLSFTRVFRVEVSDVHAGAAWVLENAAGLPALYDSYEDALGNTEDNAICKSRSAAQDESMPFWWVCTFEYSSKTEDQQYNEQNPLLRPPKIKWSTVIVQKAAVEDTNAQPIMNSSRERFDPPPEMDDNRTRLTYTRNEAVFSPGLAQAYVNKTNSDTFLGVDPGNAKIASIDADSQFENGVQFWETTYTIDFNRDGFDLKLLDAGFHELDAAGKAIKIGDPRDGSPMANAVLLNGFGHQLAPSATPIFLLFKVYESTPFAALGLF